MHKFFEKSFTKMQVSIFLMGIQRSIIWTFDCIENKYDIYPDKDLEKFSESLREHAMKVINFVKKKMMPLRKRTSGIV